MLAENAGPDLLQRIDAYTSGVKPSSCIALTGLAPGQVLKQEIKPYTPNFAKAVDHFCIHTGGRAVLEGMETQLRLSPALMEPSWHTLWRMGNTSSASIWSAPLGFPHDSVLELECMGHGPLKHTLWRMGNTSSASICSAPLGVPHASRDHVSEPECIGSWPPEAHPLAHVQHQQHVHLVSPSGHLACRPHTDVLCQSTIAVLMAP